MLKHATINRISRAQQTLQLQRQWEQKQQINLEDDSSSPSFVDTSELNNNNVTIGVGDEQINPNSNCSMLRTTPSPSPNQEHLLSSIHQQQHLSSAPQTPPNPVEKQQLHSNNTTKLPHSLVSSPSSTSRTLYNSKWHSNGINSLPTTPLKNSHNKNSDTIQNQAKSNTTTTTTGCNSDSIIKVFAQTLSQDVEYVTLHVNTQTRCQQIIKSLLKKFRLKHRDPNLFYLTLERYIRKDGLKCKNTLILSDESCPIQYQQCCSNPPYNDIKFTLQMRAGALVKIYCSDVVPDARYKCLSLSTQTTVEETIELMLHCLNLIQTTNTNQRQKIIRESGSPSSTGSSTNSSSSSSSVSSSSGIDSDLPTNSYSHRSSSSLITIKQQQNNLDENSRASSTTSISSWSNVSTVSNTILDQYCLVIECKDSNYKRILESDEYLVDVYESLLSDAKEQQQHLDIGQTLDNNQKSPNTTDREQWFLIKLKRRNEIISHHNPNNAIKFTNPHRQSIPLPPIPYTITQLNNNNGNNFDSNELKQLVSTTQIEVRCRQSSSSNCLTTALATSNSILLDREMSKPLLIDEPLATKIITQQLNNNNDLNLDCNVNNSLKNVDVVDSSSVSPSRCPPPPALIVLPPIIPRRRNLSNASSTFMPNNSNNNLMNNRLMANRRRYDPAQLEADLSKLNMSFEDDLSITAGAKSLQQDSITMVMPPIRMKRDSIVIDNSQQLE